MKQTAVETLIEIYYGNEGQLTIKDLEQAKAMEKEQIIRAHLMARCYDNENSVTEAEQYYNETFKSE